ncbi:unnamed protein product [Umbelopsis vinacea]
MLKHVSYLANNIDLIEKQVEESLMEVVYAVHNFEAENPDEIAFRIGDPITVIEKDENLMVGGR